MKLHAPFLFLLFANPPTESLAVDLNSISQIQIDFNVKAKRIEYYASSNSERNSSLDRFIQIEPVSIEGVSFWRISGEPSDVCYVDSRFSYVSPLLKFGQSHVEKVRCSDPTRRESGTITTQAKGSISKNIISITTNLNGNRDVLDVKNKMSNNMSLKIDLSNGCKVISLNFSSKSTSGVHDERRSLQSFKKDCIISYK